jgi:Kef-type K+ transport system membrane component KefB/nucleotide-binding universal stress UspA family protein
MLEFFDHLMDEFKLPLSNLILVFSVILFIILLSPVLLRKLRIPGIIGLIISGVIIGPFGFNIIAKSEAIELFSLIGLLYIMFIAGLELDLNDFKVNRNKSLVFGIFTFAIPLSFGFPICYYFLEYDLSASFLIASMFATHTLVAYPIVSKLGVSKNQAVAITVGGTILTDTAVLIILAVIMKSDEGTLNQAFWIRLIVSLSIFSVIMFMVIPRIAKWFFKTLESEKHSHYIFVLAVVFFAGFLAEVAGVEPIIGAFMAGLALNKLIPHSSALMNRIEFIGNSLFIPFFLISVGMLVNVNVILSGKTALIIAGTLTAVALIGKWLAAFATQLIFKFSKAQRQLIFGLSSAHAAATLAIILVGYKAQIIDENVLNGTIILILITCLVATFATERGSKKVLIEMSNETNDSTLKNRAFHEHILIPTESLENIEKIMEFSIFIKDKKSAQPLSILSIVSNNAEAEINILKTRNTLESYVKQGSASETKVNIITTIDHNIASGIARISREIMADIIILGTPKHVGVLERLMGEKVETVVANSDKAIFICHLLNPLVYLKRIVIVAPPLCEHENGFEHWFVKIAKLSQELSIPIVVFCDDNTKLGFEKLGKKLKLSTGLSFNHFDNWDDFLILSRDIKNDDLFVLISARKGAVSYLPILDSLPVKIEKYFEANDSIIIFPLQVDHSTGQYEDFSGESLNKGIETIQKLGKRIGSVLKK